MRSSRPFSTGTVTGNQLGAAAALASLDLLETAASRVARQTIEKNLASALPALWALPQVGDIRRVGLVVGVELVRDWTTREPFALAERAGLRVCEAMTRRGVLTRPIGNVLVLMPPYCARPSEVRHMVEVLGEAVAETFSSESSG